MSKKLLSKAQLLAGTKNVLAFAQAPQLSVVCDLKQSFGNSASGKTVLIASTSGNKPLGSTHAFIGLNVFCKSLTSVDLSTKVVSSLANLEDVSPGLQWQVVDEQYLHLLMQFDKCVAKKAASEKSVLLLTSGGIKKLGTTGISVGLNVYHPVNQAFDVNGFDTLFEASNAVVDGVTVTTADGGAKVVVAVDLAKAQERLAAAKAAGGKATPVNLNLPNDEKFLLNIFDISTAESPAESAAPDKSPKGKKKKATEAPFEPMPDGFAVRRCGDVFELEISLDASGAAFSSTGKSLLLANSHGKSEANGVAFGLTVSVPGDERLEAIIRDVLKRDGATKLRIPEFASLVGKEMKLLGDVPSELRQKIKAIIVKENAATGLPDAAADETKKRPRETDEDEHLELELNE